MSKAYHFITEVQGIPAIFDFMLTDGCAPVSVRCRHFDLPATARRLTYGEQLGDIENKLILFQDLLFFVIPLWQYGLSTPEYYPENIVKTPRDLLNKAVTPTENKWAKLLQETFCDHGVHWYHVAHVLTQVLNELSNKSINWSQIAYLLQAGSPFFATIIPRLLLEYTDQALKARLLNALLFFPTKASFKRAMSFLKTTDPTDSVGTLSLVNTLQRFDAPEARLFRERFLSFAVIAYPEGIVAAGMEHKDRDVLDAAWRVLLEQEYTNQATVHYLLKHPGVAIDKLVKACYERPDWLELLGRFGQQFLEQGYKGDHVPKLDEFVATNIDRYKWPTGERHHNRIDPEIRHALYQQELQPGTLALLHERLGDKDKFRRDNAAMHLAAYCQLPRIMVHRTETGELTTSFTEEPADRPPLPQEIVARLLSLTIEDHRITAYHFAARAVAQLVIDHTHGPGITDYLLTRAHANANGTDLVFCTYLLLLTYHYQPRQAEVRALLPKAITAVKPKAQAAFGRQLCQLYDPELIHAFLRKVAPGQVKETYALFEDLAQSVNLLQDDYHDLPLAVFHPGFSGADDHPGKRR